MSSILILGGYGNVGKLVAEYLLQSRADAQIQLAGRSHNKGLEASNWLNRKYPGANISAIKLDAQNASELVAALQDIDLLVVASSTIEHTKKIAIAALNAGVDFLDTQLSSPEKLNVLYGLKFRILNQKRVFITDGGFHPGVPAVMIRWIRNKMGPLDRANVFAALKIDWSQMVITKGTEKEMVQEFMNFKPLIWRNGGWKELRFSEVTNFDFGPPFNVQACWAMMLEEMRWLVEENPELKDAGFYVTGFNWLTDYLLLPMVFMGVKLLPEGFYGLLARLFRFGLSFSRPPYGVRLVAECEANQKLHRLSVYHQDGYHLTAIPVVACILQYLDGLISPGLWLQAFAVDPDRFFHDLKRFGVEVDSQLSNISEERLA